MTRVQANRVVGTKNIQTHLKGGASNGKKSPRDDRRPEGSKKTRKNESGDLSSAKKSLRTNR